MCMRHIVNCGLPGLSHKQDDLKKLLNIKLCLIFSNILSETFLILSRIELDTIKIYIGVHVKYMLFLSDFDET
jgi:hypothetical protein